MSFATIELANRSREKRTVSITLRLTEEEHRQLDALAQAMDLTVPNMIRVVLRERLKAKRKRI